MRPMVTEDKAREADGRVIGESGPMLESGASVLKRIVIHALRQLIICRELIESSPALKTVSVCSSSHYWL